MTINCSVLQTAVPEEMKDDFFSILATRVNDEFPDSTFLYDWGDKTEVSFSEDEYTYVQENAVKIIIGLMQDIIIFGTN